MGHATKSDSDAKTNKTSNGWKHAQEMEGEQQKLKKAGCQAEMDLYQIWLSPTLRFLRPISRGVRM